MGAIMLTAHIHPAAPPPQPRATLLDEQTTDPDGTHSTHDVEHAVSLCVVNMNGERAPGPKCRALPMRKEASHKPSYAKAVPEDKVAPPPDTTMPSVDKVASLPDTTTPSVADYRRDLHYRAESGFRDSTIDSKPPEPLPPQAQRMHAVRVQFWDSQEPPDTRRPEGRHNVRYQFSPDGSWMLESAGRPADMCIVTNRRLFNCATEEELHEVDVAPWLTFDPPAVAPVAPPASREKRVGSALLPATARQFVLREPGRFAKQQYLEAGCNMVTMNRGCHDEYPDEPEESDYITGASSVEFGELNDSHGDRVTALRASSYSNSWDTVGRHWVAFLPSGQRLDGHSTGLA